MNQLAAWCMDCDVLFLNQADKAEHDATHHGGDAIVAVVPPLSPALQALVEGINQ